MLLLLASHLSKTFLAVRTSLDMFADPSVFIKKKKKAHTHAKITLKSLRENSAALLLLWPEAEAQITVCLLAQQTPTPTC